MIFQGYYLAAKSLSQMMIGLNNMEHEEGQIRNCDVFHLLILADFVLFAVIVCPVLYCNF